MINSKQPGKDTSAVEVTHVSSYGIWILTQDKELFMSYDQFPWFKDAPIRKIINVEELKPSHFYWPELDVDLGVESIEHPERFPLASKVDAAIQKSVFDHAKEVQEVYSHNNS